MNGLMLIVCGLLPASEPVVTDCDWVEVNAVHRPEDGSEAFVQLIYQADGNIIAWRMVRDPRFIPVRRGEFYEAVWTDEGILRRVRTRHRCYTWETVDREIDEKVKWPADKRRGLGTP